MSESKHTPGPWSLEFDDVPYDGGFETMVINSENGGICMMDCPKDEMDANGRLIAAAPDLLEACEAFGAFERHTPDCANCDEWGAGNCEEGRRLYSVACDSINEAIAKAKGES